MRSNELITWGIVTSLVLNACNTKATPTIDTVGEGQGLNTPTPEFTPTPMITPTLENNLSLLDPQNRSISINATAQAVENKGFEQLIKEGFPEIVLSAYEDITRIYTAQYTSDTQEYQFGIISSTPSTRIKFYYENELYWVFITAGHNLSNELAESESANYMQIEQNDPSIKITVNSLDILKLDTLEINGSNAGLAYFLNHTSENRPDIGVITISDKSLSEEARVLLSEKKTLELNDLSFEAPSQDDRFYSVCYPADTGYRPTITTDGLMVPSDDKTRLSVDPALIGPNCSGSGMFFQDSSGRIYYAGINVETLPDNPQLNDDARVFPFYLMGMEGLNNLIIDSIMDLRSK